MKPAPAWLLAAGLALGGCISTTVDSESLRSAAAARQRRVAPSAPPLSRDVDALLRAPLTAESAAQIAVLNNRGLRAALEDVAVAQSTLAGTRRLPNPTLEGALRFRDGADPELEIGAMIDVSDLLLALSRGTAASTGVEAARLAAIGAIIDQSCSTREAFIEYQAAVQRLELRRTALLGISVASEAAERLREAGNITELELVNEQSATREAELRYRRAEVMVGAARERVNVAMGVWGRGIEWQAEARLPELPEREIAIKALETDAVRHSLDLQLAERRFAAAAKHANLARVAGVLPELKAGVSAERDDHWSVGPAVELELPLFYQGQGEIGALQATLRREQERHAELAIRIRAAARTVATQLEGAREAAIYYRDVLLPLKQRVVEQSQLHYNAMSIGIFQLLQAKRDQVETASSYIDQLRDYWIARTRAEQLLSGRLAAASLDAAAADPASPRSSGGPVDAH